VNDDDLKKLWQQQPLRVPDISPAQLISALQNKTSQLRRIVDARDLRELWACASVIIIFGFFYFTAGHNPISRAGDLIVIGSSIFIGWKLVYTRRSTPPAPPGATLVESLRAELNSVRTQSGLLGSVLWWYLLPLTVGELVSVWGGPLIVHDTNTAALLAMAFANLVVTLVIIAVNAFVYWLNQWARAKQLVPLEAQLTAMLHAAETGEPLEETHVASLRPIVVAMAAAEQVKPAEFKVAFGQLALYGEIAFIAFWFFSMIGLGIYHEDWMANEPAAQTVVQTIPTAEAKRYSVVAQKVADLCNAGDYTALEKLYDPEMAQAFPLQKTSEFYAGLATNIGRIESLESPTTNGYDGWIEFRLHGQHGEALMSLALDADSQISGFYFRPALNIKGFVVRLFSWQHLLWIVPFFLAGLLYCRLMQRLTERAVGISTLGVHLHKGQNLLLWDEIKEIRPFKMLNIYSLRLVKESGEKTIMPWTSLERHADLKAAVEAFAPANHPIRAHLSRLTRI